MHRFSSTRFLLSFTASATRPRWWPTVLARRVSPLTVSTNPHRVSLFPHESRNMSTISRINGDESDKPYRRPPITSASVPIIPQDTKHYVISRSMKDIGMRHTISEVIAGDERSDKDAEDQREEVVVSDDIGYTWNIVLEESRHRDGSIYRNMIDIWWKTDYRIANRNETRLEAMAFSDPTDCIIRNGTCIEHRPRRMLQFFSIQLAKIPVGGGLVELYGYIAVRDDVDPLLNYVVNFSRDDPIIVEQGSLIMAGPGPKRGIDIRDLALIEYDLRIKSGEEEKDDLELIDGASIIGTEGIFDCPFNTCIRGDCGAVVITLARLEAAVEATVEVFISKCKAVSICLSAV